METLGSLRRTNYCGEVSLAMAGQEMTVCGSIARARDKGGIIFADLIAGAGDVTCDVRNSQRIFTMVAKWLSILLSEESRFLICGVNGCLPCTRLAADKEKGFLS